MTNLVNPLLEIREYTELLDYLKKNAKPAAITGPSDSQKAHVCYALINHCNRKGIYVAYNEMQARKLYEDFSFFLGEEVLFFPSKEIMLYDVEAKSYDTVYQRIRVLDRMMQGNYSIIVTSAEAVSHKLISPGIFEENVIEISLNSRLDSAELARKLVMMAYEKTGTVEKAGQFSVRGGIIDIFSIDSEYAVRIELFDDEVDSIRHFDVNTQRSFDRLEKTRVLPAREVVYTTDRIKSIIFSINEDLSQFSKKMPGLSENVAEDIEKLQEDHYFPGIDRYIPYIIDTPYYLADYARDAFIFIDEPVRQRQRLENILLEHFEICRGLMEKARVLPRSQDMYFDYESLAENFKKHIKISLSTINTDSQDIRPGRLFGIPCKQMGSFQGHLELLCGSIGEWKSKNSRIVVLSGTRGRGERLAEALLRNKIEAVYMDSISVPVLPGQVVITHGSLQKGFEYPNIGFVVVSDKEVFGQDRKHGKVSGRHKGNKINIFTELNIGDYVVHEAHGIGQYVSIEKLLVEGVKRDYLKIRYQDGGFLYIPTNQLDLIQKYIGSEGKSPKLSRLGGTDWLKTKNKVRESLKELAGELIKLYAQRQAAKGFAFSADTVWQKQFEEQFPYEETDAQLKCIDEIKKDMESGRLMDRLLCGDVGYGKTEVAIRAIFKAVMDGKQVAYLVPTTVLAQQQYANFVERMKDFPVAVNMLSRFRSQSEQKKILRDVKAGNIDVLIGTHRLLQKDILFRDLGLLVIDEEQRFGVSHKEKLKNLRPDVSVLTLTATPIPRTLHMSLVGIRDISVIEDPPEERYPVQTYVMEYNRDVIQDAMLRELSRKGQVFYLYNRVRTIDIKASEIKALVPEARVAVAHGQMEERALEDIMFSFIKGEYDILVCTTIIESGLDMPNVNTIIVEDADRMGLAQLYQLRGRVGRSNRLAYAYITYKKDKVVAEIAEKRLQAIKEFTELGSGFKIAMRDMEIRGAGNLLGPEQHGHMETVGYDMYCRLLDEAVRELKGEPLQRANTEVTIDINISAYIDDSYINSETRKIEMYKKIASIQDQQDVMDIIDELTDRYGDIPDPVKNLVNIAYIKALAGALGFLAVQEKNEAILFPIGNLKTLNIEAIGKTAAKYKRQLLFNAGANPHLMYRISGINRNQILDNIKIMLQDLKNFDVH